MNGGLAVSFIRFLKPKLDVVFLAFMEVVDLMGAQNSPGEVFLVSGVRF